MDCYQPHLAEQLACTALAGSPPSRVAQELQDLQKQANSQLLLDLKKYILWNNKPGFSNMRIKTVYLPHQTIIPRDIRGKLWISSNPRMCGKTSLENLMLSVVNE